MNKVAGRGAQRVLGGMLAVVLGAGLTALPSTAAPAAVAQSTDDGLRVESTWSYTIDPDGGAVHVAATVTLTNEIPDQVSGVYINQSYFHTYAFPVPTEATGLTAVRDGAGPATVTTAPLEETDLIHAASVALSPNLFYGNSQTYRVTYDLPGTVPRSEGSTRVNPAFGSVVAIGIGDPGLVSVEVRVPDGYRIDRTGEPLEQSEEDGQIVFRADVADPLTWYAGVTISDQDRLDVTEIEVGEHTLTVEAWPGDTEWSTFVGDRLRTGLPALEDLIGTRLPDGDDLRVIETVAPYLYGYAGWYTDRTRTIEIGDELDADVVLHELSHAWFNEQWFTDRWIVEGLAQTYAARALAETDTEPLAEPEAIDADAPGALRLNRWSDPLLTDEQSEQTETFGYAASWTVVEAIVDEIGVEGMHEVLAAAQAGTTAYRGDPEAEATGRRDWRRFLDLAEELGGSEETEQLLADHVLSASEIEELEERTATRSQYGELEELGGEWTPPWVVRRAMANWDFESAVADMERATAILALRDETTADLADLGTALPASLEQAYEEEARDLDEVLASTERAAAVAADLAEADEAVHGPQGVIDRIGLLGADHATTLDVALDAYRDGDLEDASAAAASAEDTVASAGSAGIRRLSTGGLALVVLLAAALLGRQLLRHRRRKTPPPAPAPAGDGDDPTPEVVTAGPPPTPGV